MSHARIGKVRLKASGTEVRVLHQVLPNDGENWQGKLIEHARLIAGSGQDLNGFVVIGFFGDGSYNFGYRMDQDHVIGPTLLPAYVAEIIRREALLPRVVGENIELI